MATQPGFHRQVLTDTRIDIYQFTVWDQMAGDNQLSNRWGTLAGIERISGSPLLDTKAMVSKADVGKELFGLTDIGYVPDTSW